ncbi:hypothetical protein [Caulobacter soli]|uniref:hypothetical protein n=1 Tax=Caulobacter soli TaxID=2708539 RepID=UPI0013ECAA59|nr:hypothetical protein [Caulobacter soli]
MTSGQLRDLAETPRPDADWIEAARIALLEAAARLEASELASADALELARIFGG